MPNLLPLRDRIELDVLCDGLTYEQALAEIMDNCGFIVTVKPSDTVTMMSRCLEIMFLNSGEKNAEQA